MFKSTELNQTWEEERQKTGDTEREKTEAYGPFEESRGNRHISGKSLCLKLKWRMLWSYSP